MLGLFDHLDNQKKAWAAFIGAAILFLIESGLQVSGINNLPLALVIWGFAGALLVYWLRYFAWAPGLGAAFARHVTASLDWFRGWCKHTRLNPPLVVIVFLTIVAVTGAWLNYGRSPIEVPPHKQPDVYVEDGSVVWAYEKTFTIWSTAQEIYSETRKTFAAKVPKQTVPLTTKYCFGIATQSSILLRFGASALRLPDLSHSI